MPFTFRENDDDLKNIEDIKEALELSTHSAVIKLAIRCLANTVRKHKAEMGD